MSLEQRVAGIIIEQLGVSAEEIAPSPDGRWLAFQEANDIWVTPLPGAEGNDGPITLNRRDPTLPIERLSRTGGLFVRWRDASTVEFGSAARYYRHDLDARRADTFDIRLEVPRREIAGRVALTNARLVTLAGAGQDEVLERGTVVVDGRRIGREAWLLTVEASDAFDRRQPDAILRVDLDSGRLLGRWRTPEGAVVTEIDWTPAP